MTELWTNPALRAAAVDAGMHDADALALADLTGVSIAADGTPQLPLRFFEITRAMKPHLFKKHASQMDAGELAALGRSLTAPPPFSPPHADKKFADMTPTEQREFERFFRIRIPAGQAARNAR